jgi:Ca-activated chloride channel family protein
MSPQELFALPGALPILLLGPAVWLIWLLLDRARTRRLHELVGPRTKVLARELDRGERTWRRRLSSAGLLAASVAVLQPLGREDVARIEQRGVDLLVCLDVSRSMLARDLRPSRLESARREIAALAERARGDRLGLVLFAGEARLVVPLTADVGSFSEMVSLASPTSVVRGGTDLGLALEAALEALVGESGEHEVILLLTDGEDHEGKGLRAAEACRDRGITVHCVGFGSMLGAKIPIETARGESFLRDAAGQEIVSALDPASLRAMAEATGGTYLDATTRPLPLVDLYEKRILPMARKAFAVEERRQRENRFQWPLLAAFLLWILELGLTDRKKR